MATAAPDRREEVRQRLLLDPEFYAEKALRIVDKQGREVPFVYKEPQARFARALLAQREAGQPMRGVALKARQVGISTQAQGWLIQRATQLQWHNSLVAAHSLKTVGALFKMGQRMHAGLPEQIKPKIRFEGNVSGRQYLEFGEPSRQARQAGMRGLDSSYHVATAQAAQDGRGLTFRTLHLSEVAFWETAAMLAGVLNAVPDDPDSLIIMESTAFGENHFKDVWDAAVAGENGYFPFFTSWFEEPAYRRPFANEDEREDFEAKIGGGAYGEDEQELAGLIRAYWGEHTAATSDELDLLVSEFLHWRRWAIGAKTTGSLEKFKQEYPSTPDEAFLSTGRKVFAAEYVARVRKQVEVTDPVLPTEELPGPARGVIRGMEERPIEARRGTRIMVPKRAVWVPRKDALPHEKARWEVWEPPVKEGMDDRGQKRPAGQYVIGADPASGEENEGAKASHAAQVIDHRTLRQVAQLEAPNGTMDPDEFAKQLLLAALFFNRAWIGVEVTGGWGGPVARLLARGFKYPYVWAREIEDKRTEKHEDRLGWDTNMRTKPHLIARGQGLLREGVDGIRSRKLAAQLGWYVFDENGRSGPQPGKLADLLMAWLIAEEIAARRPMRPDRARGAISTTA